MIKKTLFMPVELFGGIAGKPLRIDDTWYVFTQRTRTIDSKYDEFVVEPLYDFIAKHTLAEDSKLTMHDTICMKMLEYLIERGIQP